MRTNAVLGLVPFVSALVSGLAPPNYPGFWTLWSDSFDGSAGQLPNAGQWSLVTNIHVNNEMQEYTTSNQNVQISGGGTIQFVPRKTNGKWTSGRIESKQAFTPEAGKVTMVESVIRFSDNSRDRKQGIWPAFWMLGEAVRHGTPWPLCGEIDIMENVNGLPTGYGTVHCGYSDKGGPCNEPQGRAGTTGLPDSGWHRWTIKIDRTRSYNWRDEVIFWYLDGQQYYALSGGDLGDEHIWTTIARSPMFIILNLAVGGNWPGAPNGATADSWGSMMEVEYVAVYST
ncbi:glycoside hydrolase family 16 protein [Podospora didyma]|uniref:Glycoside hydrolase family 16 protein n=1 Tax=Podospora didyma TaxID=330526 RepID=A0AAE0JYW6_9PEZI|nr:glycoside hydrolase family 16 protein [Podospora didyma]